MKIALLIEQQQNMLLPLAACLDVDGVVHDIRGCVSQWELTREFEGGGYYQKLALRGQTPTPELLQVCSSWNIDCLEGIGSAETYFQEAPQFISLDSNRMVLSGDVGRLPKFFSDPHGYFSSRGDLSWIPRPREIPLGNLNCAYNAQSPLLRCAVNPCGPCEGCESFTVAAPPSIW